jgi:Mn-dependent DtxR family transcriptional regulator
VVLSNIINNVGKRREVKAAGLPSLVKVQPVKVLKQIKIMSKLENLPTQREMSRKVGVSPPTVNRILKKLGKRLARKT